MIVLTLFIIVIWDFFLRSKGSKISVVDLPTTDILEPFYSLWLLIL